MLYLRNAHADCFLIERTLRKSHAEANDLFYIIFSRCSKIHEFVKTIVILGGKRREIIAFKFDI